MKTFEEIVKWVRKNVPKENLADHRNAREAAKWFVAYTEASMMRESNCIKDWAQMLIHGVRRLNPTLTVSEWATNTIDRGGKADEAVSEEELKRFFGV